MAKVISYARFSPRPMATADGDDDSRENSCDVQLADNRKWCAEHNHNIVAEFREDAISGDGERQILNEALSACKRGYIFLVRDFDRISRIARFRMQVATDLASSGVSVWSRKEGLYQHDNDELWLAFGMLSLLGEYQRRKTKKITKAKSLEHQAGGRRMSEKPPFGWKLDVNSPPTKRIVQGKLITGGPSRIIPDEDEQAVIVRIAEAYKAGESLAKIAADLERDGVKCRRSKAWYRAALRSILRRAGVRMRAVGRRKKIT